MTYESQPYLLWHHTTGLWSQSQHPGLETNQRLVSRKIGNVSVSGSRRIGLGHLRLVPKTNLNSFLMGMQMAPYAVW